MNTNVDDYTCCIFAIQIKKLKIRPFITHKHKAEKIFSNSSYSIIFKNFVFSCKECVFVTSILDA